MRIAAERRDINILSRARQITSKDFDEFNYILAMDDSNFRNIQDLKNRTASTGFASIKKIQDFRSVFNEQEVPDPYFGGDEGFDYVLDILKDSVMSFKALEAALRPPLSILTASSATGSKPLAIKWVGVAPGPKPLVTVKPGIRHFRCRPVFSQKAL